MGSPLKFELLHEQVVYRQCTVCGDIYTSKNAKVVSLRHEWGHVRRTMRGDYCIEFPMHRTFLNRNWFLI